MRRLSILALCLLPTTTLAKAFERPIPQAQSATAEMSFFLASIALIVALLCVHLLVRRR